MANEHTDKRYEEELKKLREEILYMGGLVEDQIQKAVKSLVDRDSQLAEIIVERDHEVNRLDVDIDDLCIGCWHYISPPAAICASYYRSKDHDRPGADRRHGVNFASAPELNQEPQLKPYIDIPGWPASPSA
jgi:phosphate transport system protein